ncbi:hypothetical protein ACIPVB_13120 [Microbacterium sp. NPDC090007]|uniref:hypothetical protein n=1 Tax=Microbacterium sp. NPDC090007 TaxID=3364204 RepID=UPI0038213122
MPKRDNGVSRRLRGASVLAAVLVLGTGTAAAHAYWQRSETLGPGSVDSGDLNVTAAWLGSPPAPAPLYPGQFRDVTLLVTETGASGTTLRWRLTPTVTLPISATEATFVQTSVHVQTCGTGPVIPPGSSYAPSGGFLPGDAITLCVRFTLRADAPSDLDDVDLDPSILLAAEQVLS